jgi:hypothetical protein
MSELLVNYEMVCELTKERNTLVGLSEEQLGCFKYELGFEGEKSYSSIHISHFTTGRYIIVYNKSYVLKPSEVIYLFKDIGGEWFE